MLTDEPDTPLCSLGSEPETRISDSELFVGKAFNSLPAVKVDRNYSYAVFVSYAEVYNEKVS